MSTSECCDGAEAPDCAGSVTGVVTLDEVAAVKLATALKVLADPVRLRLLELLATSPGGEVCACDLVEPLGRSQPTISHHLKVLREAELINSERRGTWIWYSVNRDAVRQAVAALQTVTGLHPALA
ncbi:helix-turn-helix transcriptional regulator [Microbispora sp. RL4-1S]|uniref:Helix-turn-helix transcriptional regulator n=1 Tax=Microbispora oryzae TaxID=2806554 RepID=A0A940WP16_9ACTN|nr:metalloregulator ArsR/SmtB family transcription factor [Microbispora oryzae]MBP2704244.1 helix-turn-helix transcriptional regulator [Microbispora oryzae]